MRKIIILMYTIFYFLTFFAPLDLQTNFDTEIRAKHFKLSRCSSTHLHIYTIFFFYTTVLVIRLCINKTTTKLKQIIHNQNYKFFIFMNFDSRTLFLKYRCYTSERRYCCLVFIRKAAEVIL